MSAASDDERRFARHVVLAEIGDAGQARLRASRVRAPASATTREYLRRAGVVLADDGATPRAVCERADAVVRDPSLRDAAAAVLDAFAAVETIKALVGVGTPATWPDALVLDEDPA